MNTKHCDFKRIEIKIRSFHTSIRPWEGDIPSFWDAYNQIKHKGAFKVATLDMAINSLAGLFAVLLAFYKRNVGSNFIHVCSASEPIFFDYPNLGANHLLINSSYNLIIPGF